MIDWEKKFWDAEAGFQHLKALTKKYPASGWSPEYRELAEAIHSLGREVFYVEKEGK